MKPLWILVAVLASVPGICRGQHGGNVTYSDSGGRGRAETTERNNRILSDNELPPTSTSTLVDASVLINVKADEYVAVFGLSQIGETVAECGRKLDATVRELTDAIKPLGLAGDDVFVDFVAQNPVYGYETKGDKAHETLVGFELKKNVAIHYVDRSLLDKLVAAAARLEIYDLIKVDYHVKDADRIHDRLMDEAAQIIKRKLARYETLLGLKLQGAPAQVYAERYAVHYPTQLYDSYTAYESEAMRGRFDTAKDVRKTRTAYYNGLDASGFDHVVNPVLVEPAVQFTLYLKLKYEPAPPPAANRPR
jgi:uncharacterized protein YggE